MSADAQPLATAGSGAVLEEALGRYGRPEILNTDQGAQFTSAAFLAVLQGHPIRRSMDGRGAWKDKVCVERIGKSLKYEEVYLHTSASVSEALAGIARYVSFYNTRRPDDALRRRTPDQAIAAGRLHEAAVTTRGVSLTPAA